MALLRPALEAAVVVAREGAESDPPVAAPTALRPFLSFRRLSGRALERARRVLDEDEEFRSRVRDAVEREQVGPAGWLFLDRPEGWDDQLAELVGDAAQEAEEADRAEEVGRLRRELDRMRTDRDEARAELDGLRRSDVVARAEAEGARAELDAAEARLREVEVERDTALEERARAVRDLKAQELRAAARLEELRRAQDDLATARREVTELEEALDDEGVDLPDRQRATDGPGDDASGAAPGEPDAAEDADETPGASTPSPGAPATDEAPTAAEPAIDRASLAIAVARAAEAAALLSAALVEVANVAGPSDPGPQPVAAEPRPGGAGSSDAPGGAGDEDDEEAEGVAAPSATSLAVARPAGPGDGAPSVRREPVPLPVGVFDDSPEAALHWLRHPGTTLVVDGYNVSLRGWPTLALADQRQRLLGALEALAARTGCHAVVVFDGADVGVGTPTGSRPRGVQVRFTAAGVEADDEILAVLDALPAVRPVTVASGDRRVADGARRRGASVVGSEQLLSVLDG